MKDSSIELAKKLIQDFRFRSLMFDYCLAIYEELGTDAEIFKSMDKILKEDLAKEFSQVRGLEPAVEEQSCNPSE